MLGTWLLLAAMIIGGAGALGPKYENSFSIPGTPAQVALNFVDERFPVGTQDADIKVIFIAPEGQDITSFTDTIGSAVDSLSTLANVSKVDNPFSDASTTDVSSTGDMAYASIHFDSAKVSQREQANIRQTVEKAITASGLTVAYSGMENPVSAGDSTEAIGLLISFVVLVITFGSLLAAGMPLITAGLGVGISMSLLIVGSHVLSLSSTTPLLAEMLGLAVGIDYALFIVSRHRAQLAQGMDVRQSIAVATATAGSAVVFAGTTVIIALLGLGLVGIPFLWYMGVGAALAVLVALTVALILLPAVLSLCGKTLIPRPQSRAARRENAPEKRTLGARWVRLVTAKPLLTLVLAVGALVGLALPAVGMRLALPDNGNTPVGSITREGYDALAKGWGPGTNGPLIVAADLSQTDIADIEKNLDALGKAFTGVSNVASVTEAIPNEALDAAILQITPKSSPDSVETEELVRTLRQNAESFEAQNGFSYMVTGQTAIGIDMSAQLGVAIVPYAVVVVGLSLILLLIVFRSLAVPLSATGGFLLSVGAAFGVTNAVFEHGVGASLIGLAKVGPIISFMPILVMAVLFGLAMDYQVFLVSRMRERFTATGDGRASVRSGFVGSARVVTAAALIMTSVFFSFVPGGEATIQSLALALAVGVAVDAFVVRMTIIPALMYLLDSRAWALPGFLSRIIPDVDIEGEKVHGRLETLTWHQNADTRIIIAAADVSVSGTAFRPFTFTAHAGDLVVLTADAESPADVVLAALTGRTSATGMLVAGGRPLPYDGYALRRSSSLVLTGAPVMSGSLKDQLAEQLRLDRVAPNRRGFSSIRNTIQRLATASGIPFTQVDPLSEMEALTTEEVWLCDLAVAVLGDAEIVAVDARRVTEPTSLIAELCQLLPPTTTIVAATTKTVEPSALMSAVRSRTCVTVDLVENEVVTA